ncbi:MAG: DUF1080 domain-containing protein [Phycisphaerae bacterium]|nr:DUF1080 domain-containing protein [Phycisphaerae bacterium]
MITHAHRHPVSLTLNFAIVVTLLSLTACVTCPRCLAAENDETEFKPLFDGKTLDDWEIMGNKKDAFTAEDGVLHCHGKGGAWIRYNKREFENFILRADYKLDPKTNSGLFIHVTNPKDPVYSSFEVQILDDHGQEPNKHSSGAIYDVATPMFNMSKPAGEWNEVEICCDNGKVIVRWNGRKVIDCDFNELTKPIGKFKTPYAKLGRKGWIGMQDHGHPIWFRNIRIKELPARAAKAE